MRAGAWLNKARQNATITTAALAATVVLQGTAHANVILGPGVDGGFMAAVGSPVLGVIEGFIARALFRAPLKRSIGVMVVANYVSSYFGLFLAGPLSRVVSAMLPGHEIFRLNWFIWVAFAVCYIATLVIEFPFCWRLLGGGRRTLARAAAFCLVAQSATYALLVPYYYVNSSMSLYEGTTIVPDTKWTANPGAVVYFIDEKGETLCKTRLDGTGKQVVAAMPEKGEFNCLCPIKDGQGNWQLWAEAFLGVDITLVLERFPYEEDAVLRSAGLSDEYGEDISGARFGRVRSIDSRPAEDRGVRVYAAGLRNETLAVTGGPQAGYGATHSLTYEVPTKTVAWGMANVLAGGEVVVDIDGQIVLIDVKTMKIGFLTEGRGPFVVPDAPSGGIGGDARSR